MLDDEDLIEFHIEESDAEEKLRKREMERRRDILRVAAGLLSLGVLASLCFVLLSLINDTWATPMGVVVILVAVFFGAACIVINNAARRADIAAARTEARIANHLKKITEAMDSRLRPLVTPLINFDMLISTAAEAIRQVRVCDKEISPQGKTVFYIGSIGAGAGEGIQHADANEGSAIVKYQAEQTLLIKEKISVVRIINMINATTVPTRGEDFQERYVRWVKHQLQLIHDNPEYHLYHCKRAPRWGAATSWMFAGPAAFQIVGDGFAGTRFLGDEVVENIRKSTLTYLDSGKNRRVQWKAEKVEEYLKQIEATSNVKVKG